MRNARYIHARTNQVFASSELIMLTERDIEILRHVQRGMLSGQLQRDVALEVGYRFASTLRQQLQRMKHKLEVVTTTQLINKAVRLGILRSGYVSQRVPQKIIARSGIAGPGTSGPRHPWRKEFAQSPAKKRETGTRQPVARDGAINGAVKR